MATLVRLSRASLSATRGRALYPNSFPAATATFAPVRRWLSDEGLVNPSAGADSVDTPAAAALAPGTHVGTVKFYARGPAFGFIQADDESLGGDVYVQGPDLRPDDAGKQEKHGARFLKRGQRVSFDAEENERPSSDGGTINQMKARRVRCEDGSEVPLHRNSPKPNLNQAFRILGHAVFRMMESESETDSEHVGKRVLEIYENTMKDLEEKGFSRENLNSGSEVRKEKEDVVEG